MSKKGILMDAARLVRRHGHIARLKLHVAHIAEVLSREQNALNAKTTIAEANLRILSESRTSTPAGVRFSTFGTNGCVDWAFPCAPNIPVYRLG
jgi:hypothetical protein